MQATYYNDNLEGRIFEVSKEGSRNFDLPDGGTRKAKTFDLAYADGTPAVMGCEVVKDPRRGCAVAGVKAPKSAAETGGDDFSDLDKTPK